MMVKSCLATAKVQIVVVGVGGWVEAWDAHARGAHAPWTAFQPANSFGPIAYLSIIRSYPSDIQTYLLRIHKEWASFDNVLKCRKLALEINAWVIIL
jgi:hypothetical protein